MLRRPTLLAAPALILASTLAAFPAAAQDSGGDDVNTLIIYGDDECPESTGETITVCARMDESERYRIPEVLRSSDDPAYDSWVRRVESFETVGRFGPLSCSPAGLGGELGCTPQMIEAAYADRAAGNNVRFSELIAAARAERLSEIDAEAAATQGRVEEIERQRMESGTAPPEPSAEPQVVDPADIPAAP